MAKKFISIDTERIKGIFWRGVPELFALTSLETGPNYYSMARYSIPRLFAALYFGSSPDLCEMEINNKPEGDRSPIKLIKYQIDVDDIVDLTNPKVLDSLKVSIEDIVKPVSELGAYIRTHQIAQTAYENRLNGILAPSSHDPINKEWKNLILYPANIIRGQIKELN